MPQPKWSILGAVGVPGNYGGFETLAENLVRYHFSHGLNVQLSVYCSGISYPDRPARFHDAELQYVNWKANGVQSIPYDVFSLFSAVRHRSDVILLLGSGPINLLERHLVA